MMDYYRQQQFPGFPGGGFPGGGFPGGGGFDRRLDQLERRVSRLDQQVERIDRRLDRIERRLGIRDYPGEYPVQY